MLRGEDSGSYMWKSKNLSTFTCIGLCLTFNGECVSHHAGCCSISDRVLVHSR